MRTSRRPHGLIFDEVPTLYHRFRPPYPDAAIDSLMELADLRPGASALEIGAGTGQLTVPLLARGLHVTALEPGPRMAAFLLAKLPDRAAVTVVQSRFEDARVAEAAFDAVVAGTAFHWVDPKRRFALAASALRASGALVLLRTDHALTESNAAYYQAAARLYQRLAPEVGPPYLPPREADVPSFVDEVAASLRFEIIAERRYGWDAERTPQSLVGLLRTYSNHRAVPSSRRSAFLRELARLVDDDLGGRFVDRYVTTLCVARRRT